MSSLRNLIKLITLTIFSFIVLAMLTCEIVLSANIKPSKLIQKLISKESSFLQNFTKSDLPQVQYEAKSASLLPQNIENTQAIKDTPIPPNKKYTSVDFPKFSLEYPASWKVSESGVLDKQILISKNDTKLSLELKSRLTYDGFGYTCSEKAEYKQISEGFAGWTRVYKDQEWVYVKNYNVYIDFVFKKEPGFDFAINDEAVQVNKKILDQGGFASGAPSDFEPGRSYKICLNKVYSTISMKKGNFKIEGRDLATYGVFTVNQTNLNEELLVESDQIIINSKGVKDPLKLPCNGEECGSED
jgi:hypothetical protein